MTRESATRYHIGTAAWNIPPEHRRLFPELGSLLERYSRRLGCVEINSSFYKNHRPETFERWAESVREDFRFSVKLSKHITHERMLDVGLLDLQTALEGILHLREKLGILLMQLPPRLEFQARLVDRVLDQIRRFYFGPIAIEPRNMSWADSEVSELLPKHGASLVQADPPMVIGLKKAQFEAGKFRYVRLHGTPDIYRSNYEPERLREYVAEFATLSRSLPIWCIFDNTIYGHATLNALQLTEMLSEKVPSQTQLSFFPLEGERIDSKSISER